MKTVCKKNACTACNACVVRCPVNAIRISDSLKNYNAYIDSLIEKLEVVVCHCQTYNIELSICGELAGVPEVFKRLYDIGIRQFSISPSNAKAIDVAIKECVQ